MRRALLALLVCLSVLPAHTQQPRHETDRVTSAVDMQRRHTLRGHLPGWATPQNDLGAVTTDLPLDHLTVVLARSAGTQVAFEQLLDDQQNPSSSRYQQWLTPRQVGEQFGLTDDDIEAVTSWLASQGLRVDSVAPGRSMITFSGASSAVGRALGTEFHRYRVHTRRGEEERISINTEPAIPVALAPVIAAFSGLSTEDAEPQSIATDVVAPQAGSSITPAPLYTTSSTTHYVSPADFVTIFDIKPAYNAGINGSGVKVAVIGRSRVLASDITSFQTNTGLSTTAQPVTILAGTTDPGVAADVGEQTLDVNRVMSTAPGAETDLVINSSLSTAVQYEVNFLLDPIMTISYGGCEASVGSTADLLYSGFFSIAAAEGITTFVSSGDSAVAGCATDFSNPPASAPIASINYICANQYATCVGGTELADTASPSSYWSSSNSTGLSSALGYIPEGAWNEPTSNSTTSGFQVAGTGGGASLYISKPSWQTGTGVPADGVRDTPDMALPAAGHDGYYSCLNSSCATAGHFTVFAGTSAAAPGMAGIMALVVQKLGKSQGNFNPTLYRLAAATSLGVFHDTTPASSGVATCVLTTASMCNNSTPGPSALTGGLAGYAITTGYDLATGWGSVDVAKLLTAVVTPYVTPTVSVTATSSTIALGGSDSFTVTVSGTPGTPSGTAQLYDGSTLLGSATLSSGTATFPGQIFTTGGAHSITAQYAGDTVFVAATSPVFTLAVSQATPTVTLTTSATALLAGQGVTLGATVGGSSATPTGTVDFFANNAILGGALLLNGATMLHVQNFSSAGTYAITAQYSGDANYAAATSNTVTIVVTAAASSPYYNLTPAAGALTITSGATTGNTYNLTATSVNSFTGTVPLTCTVTYNVSTTVVFNPPACSLAPASIVLAANGTASTVVTINTTAAHAAPGGSSARLALGAGAALACILLCLPLKRHKLPPLIALLAMLTLGGLAGCGSGIRSVASGPTDPGTALGSYTVTVTGTFSGAATSTSFTLTVN